MRRRHSIEGVIVFIGAPAWLVGVLYALAFISVAGLIVELTKIRRRNRKLKQELQAVVPQICEDPLVALSAQFDSVNTLQSRRITKLDAISNNKRTLRKPHLLSRTEIGERVTTISRLNCEVVAIEAELASRGVAPIVP